MLRRSFPQITQGLALLPWEESYAIGVSEIDEDHRRLLNLFNEFAAKVLDRGEAAHASRADADLLTSGNAILSAFFNLLTAHCEREEMVISTQDSLRPQLALHRHDHSDFLATVQSVRDSFEHGLVSAYETAFLLYDWMQRHVLEGDRDLFGHPPR